MSTKISATIIADSKNEFGQRLITYVLVFPRIILAELNTHRMFSRNSASSRAIPFKKMLEKVQNDPFIPIAWQKDHKGMQGSEYLTAPIDLAYANDLWLEGRDAAVKTAKNLNKGVSLTKQLCNRLLEPFMWHTVIITATEWENFFALRSPKYMFNDGDKEEDKEYTFRSKKDAIKHFGENEVVEYPDGNVLLKDLTDLQWLKLNEGQAEIHMMALAEVMWDAMNESTPKELKAGEWHIPFGDQMDEDRLYKVAYDLHGDHASFKYDESWKIKVATARCARVSYMNFDGSDDYEKDIALYDRLAASGHMSPFEHVAKAMTREEYDTYYSGILTDYTSTMEGYSPQDPNAQGWCGNFRGFIQMRKMIPNENRTV